MAKKKSVIVIGAGLAGLAAAYKLRRRCNVTVLEARDRIGGRVLTHHFIGAPTLHCELGGEWIGKNHTEMKRLCRRLVGEPKPHQFGNAFWDQENPAVLVPPDQWCMSAAAQKIWKDFEKDFFRHGKGMQAELDALDWWTVLKKRGFTHEDLLRRDLMDSTDFGETIRMNSGWTAATEYLSSKGSPVDNTDEMDSKVPGGNSLLVDAMADLIGRANIQIKAPVMKIEQMPSHLEVTVQGSGKPLKADYCVCAAPARCLTDIEWTPDPPTEKLKAAAELQYARITKTAVLCSYRFWPKTKSYYGFSVFTPLASDYVFDSTFKQPGEKGILCSYAIGDKADDIATSPLGDLKYWIVEDVANTQQNNWTRSQSLEVALDIEQQAWQNDHFMRGAYAFYRPGQWSALREPLARRWGRVWFAGEHIADWQGFMEGAVQTGFDAAEKILGRIRP